MPLAIRSLSDVPRMTAGIFLFTREIPYDEAIRFETGDDLKEGDEGNDVGKFPELGRAEIAGDPGTDSHPDQHPEDPVEQQPAGVADRSLEMGTSFQPFPDDVGQVFGPGTIHRSVFTLPIPPYILF